MIPENAKTTYVNLAPGDPAPWFHQRSGSNPTYAFDTVAGRWIVLCFFGTAGDDDGRRALAAIYANRALFDDERACFFGISLDPNDEATGRVADSLPGLRHFWDFDGTIARLYGAVAKQAVPNPKRLEMRRFWLVLDPTMRVRRAVPFQPQGAELPGLIAYLNELPAPESFAGIEVPVPVLILPQVFEPDFCRELIAIYEAKGGAESGFMREVGGKTVEIRDTRHKVRRDVLLDDSAVIRQTQVRIQRRIVPEIRKVHQFEVTRMERYLIACYAADERGHFRPHRDNTTRGTAHRRFAVSINLNEEFEGGEIGFPEYGPKSFKLPAGTACVFSCSLLHMVSPVIAGKRYAFLPFLYDEVAARQREANNEHLGEGVEAYKA
jgi:predicted 2-oxoglutarate/Fe(II)-dependent dioxygenase YbiX/peroxiredoxin